MASSHAARRYARALFGLAENRNELETTENSLGEACKSIKRHPEISHLVLNSTIARDEKEDFIDKVFLPPVSPLVVQFIKVLIRKRRFQELAAIQEEFHRRLEKKNGVEEVTAITAIPLSRANREKLHALLKNKLHAEVKLFEETNPNILGGLILKFGGYEINGSYRYQLDEIKQQLFA